MATSTSSYRRSTTLRSGNRGDGNAAALQNKLEQARQQRTAFYRRLARVQADDDRDEVEVETETSTRRRRQLLDSSSPLAEVVSSVSSTNSPLLEPPPEPRSSWRYYTSYDNGEWRRHATPIYKSDAEQDVGAGGKLSERRSASMSAGLTTHDEIEIEDGEGSSSHSRPTSALTRQRLRGSASLTRGLPAAATLSATDTGPTTLEEVKMVMKDVFDRSRYGSSYDVSELVQKILGERLRQREPSSQEGEDRVIYANSERRSILDNVTQPLRPTMPEIPEGSDEKDFEEKTLAPSGRRWTSSPPPDSQRIVVVQDLFDDGYYDGGLRYEEIGAGADGRGTSLENQRDSSCHSLSNVPDMPNGEREDGMEFKARWGIGGLPAGGRTVVTGETTRHQESRTVSEGLPPTSMTQSRKDAFGRRIPADAVEIKVEMQRSDNEERPSLSKSQLRTERNSAAVEQWLHSSDDKTSSTGRQRGVVETDEKLEARSGSTPRHDDFTSSGDGWTRVASTKSSAKSSADDGRIWIPVIHVSGASASKNEATRSDVHPSPHLVKTESRRDEVVSRGEVGYSSQHFIDVADPRHRDRPDSTESRGSAKDAQEVAEDAAGQSAMASTLRTGSGVGSYGYRSSIVVDRGSAHSTQPVVSQSSSSRSSVTMQRSAGDDDWIVEKAL